MACSIIKTDQDDISELEMQEDKDFFKLNKMVSKVEDKTIQLERGGVIIKTDLGNIQYGMPPETVKDVINQKIDIPVYYIIPTDRFDKKYGINVAEFEFPAYFNFFVKKRKINLIVSEEAEKAIRIVFQETLLGPIDHPNLEQDFPFDYPKESYPNFREENKIFSVNENDPNDKGLTIDTLLNFIQYDKNTKSAKITQDQTTVEIINDEGTISIVQNGVVLEKLIDNVHLSQQNISHLVSSFDILAQKQINEMHLIEGNSKQFTIQELSDEENDTTNVQSSNSERSIQQKSQYINQPKIKSSQEIHPLKRSGSGVIDQEKIQSDVGLNKFVWNNKGGKTKTMSENYNENIIKPNETFTPPDFGITILGASHGFDPNGNTSGFIVWVYGKGIMVDPPPFASSYLKKMGIQTNILIKAIIISHCHADHDAGTFHKVLDDSQIEIITTRTIMNSFLKKYSALSKMSKEQLQVLYTFRPVQIGATMHIHGAEFKFFYALHTIPCIGFECKVQNKSMYFSADTFYDPKKLKELSEKGKLSYNRYKQLAFPDFESQDVILHEAGVPPIHTPQSVLGELPSHIKNKLYLNHIAQKDLNKSLGLKIVGMGVENTLIILPSNNAKNMETKKRIELLSNIDILQSLTIKNINWLLDSLQVEKYKSGDLICEQGTIGDKFYIIESGVARIFSLKKENPFERFFSIGDYFGESSLLAQNKQNSTRQASVEALTDMVVLTLEKNDFWFVFGNGADGPGKVIQKFYNLSSSRQYKVNNCLQKNSLLQELTPGQKTQLEMILTVNEAKKGDIIWTKNTPVNFGILIKKGAFQFFDCKEDEELVPGYFICETKAMMEKQDHQTNVKCTNKGQYFTIKKNDLIRFLKKNPGLNVLFRDLLYFD